MLKKIGFIFYLSLTLFCSGFAKENEEIDIKTLSEAIGHIIGKNLDDFGIQLDLKRMIKGIKKGSLNKPSPMSEDECLQALAKLQMKANEKTCVENLKQAEEFLDKNANEENVVEIEKGKLQYKLLKQGKGSTIQSYNTPIVKLTGKYLDGKAFTDLEEVINLNETLPSIQKAIVGMKKHEKRQVFVHPDLAFGKTPPGLNALVILDIEIVNVEANKNPPREIARDKKVF